MTIVNEYTGTILITKNQINTINETVYLRYSGYFANNYVTVTALCIVGNTSITHN